MRCVFFLSSVVTYTTIMFGLHPILSVSLVCYKSFKNNFNLDWLSFNWNSRLAFTEPENKKMTGSLAQLSHGLSTARGQMIFGIDERILPTLQIINMPSWYWTTCMRLRRSKRNWQILCEMPEG